MNPTVRRTVARLAQVALVLVVATLAATQVVAQPYPSRPIRLVVPFPPGGAVDFYARVVQAQLAEALGQPIIIDNKAGASGMIGAELVAKAAPDGYTLLLGNIASLAINVGIYPKMPYDPAKDFTPIIRTVDVNYVLVVHPGVPVKTVPELIAYTKANPGKLSYGSAGSGSLPHLSMELFKAQTGTDFVHVPYKGGGPMVTDLLGGSIQIAIGDQANLMPQVTAGKLRALAVASPKRSSNAPELPTIAEAGVAGFEATAWQGLMGPPGLPADVVRRLNDAFNGVMAMPAVREKLVGGGLDPIGGSPDDFARFIRSEIGKWSKIAKDVGAKAE
ncbi:MAG: tripartite tricarboxylate transporter substrate binding protein [Betaproteobacteria bacterium]